MKNLIKFYVKNNLFSKINLSIFLLSRRLFNNFFLSILKLNILLSYY